MTSAGGKVVSIFGAYDPPEGGPAYETARQVGRVLGELGYTIANGGYSGAMEASARGAKEAGACTVGVTCGIWSRSANDYIDRCVHTSSLPERVNRLIELGDGGYVVLPGANGTLVELALVWESKCLGRIVDRPLVCVGPFWRPLIDLMREARASSSEHVSVVDEPEQLRRIFAPV